MGEQQRPSLAKARNPTEINLSGVGSGVEGVGELRVCGVWVQRARDLNSFCGFSNVTQYLYVGDHLGRQCCYCT